MPANTRTSTFGVAVAAATATIAFWFLIAVGVHVWHDLHVGSSVAGSGNPSATQARHPKNDEVAALDKRIDDANVRTSDIVIALTLFALLLTAIVAAGTYFGFVGARQRAREAAEQWMAKHTKDLGAQIASLERSAKAAEQLAADANKHANEANAFNDNVLEQYKKINAASAFFDRKSEELLLVVKSAMVTSTSFARTIAEPALSDAQRRMLKIAEQNLLDKPDEEYSVSDWETRGITAFGLDEFEDAAKYFRNAAFVPGALAQDIARTGVSRGLSLGRLKRVDEAISAYDDVILHYKDDADPVVREQAAKAFVNKTASQYVLGDFKGAIATSDIAVAAYEGDVQPELRAQVGHVLYNKAQSLSRLDKDPEAVGIYDDIVRRYGDDAAPALRDIVIEALISKGIALARLGRFDDVIEAVDGVLKRFDAGAGPSEPRVQSETLSNAAGLLLFAKAPGRALVAAEKALALAEQLTPEDPLVLTRALTNQADALAELGEKDKAFAALDGVLKRFKDTSDATLRLRLMTIEFMRAVVLGWLDRRPEAIAAFDEFIERHSASTNVWARKMVEKSTEYRTSQPDQWKFVDVIWQNE